MGTISKRTFSELDIVKLATNDILARHIDGTPR